MLVYKKIIIYTYNMFNYCIVFDMDETLGFFAQISRLWLTLQEIYNYKLRNQDFFELCNLFPKILRPNIIQTLKYIHKLKTKNLTKIVLYTNNTGPKWWPNLIIEYIENKIGYKVFDVIITGYKSQGSCRTSPFKTYDDLVRCADISTKEKICFIDDQPHRKLAEHKQVTHIYVNAYNYFYTNTDIFKKLNKLHYYKPIYNDIIRKNLEEYLLEYNSKKEENTDIKYSLDEFLINVIKENDVKRNSFTKKMKKTIRKSIHKNKKVNKTKKNKKGKKSKK